MLSNFFFFPCDVGFSAFVMEEENMKSNDVPFHKFIFGGGHHVCNQIKPKESFCCVLIFFSRQTAEMSFDLNLNTDLNLPLKS